MGVRESLFGFPNLLLIEGVLKQYSRNLVMGGQGTRLGHLAGSAWRILAGCRALVLEWRGCRNLDACTLLDK